MGERPHDKPLDVMCHRGGRGERVAWFLGEKGYGNAVNVYGGIDEGSTTGGPGVPRC